MRPLEEPVDRGFNSKYTKRQVHCKALEDSTGVLALALVPKIQLRTQYINILEKKSEMEI